MSGNVAIQKEPPMAKRMLQVQVRYSEGGDRPYKVVAEGSWRVGDEPTLNAFVPKEVFSVLDNLSLPFPSAPVSHNVRVGNGNYQIAIDVITKGQRRAMEASQESEY
jgi:hypothetical protein